MGKLVPFYSDKDLTRLEENLAALEGRHNRMMFAVMGLRLHQEKAREYAWHGFMRRFGTLRRCIENSFALISPATDIIPEKQVLDDAQINVQAFFANVYGSIDNLAWVWVCERGLEQTIARSRIGFRVQNKEMRATLSPEFRNYLTSRDGWMDHVIEYRDALAHRIPLYIPPGSVRPRDLVSYNDLERQINDAIYRHQDPTEYRRLLGEQSRLLFFQPMITHSAVETSAHYPLHAQMIADFLTMEEFGYKMFDQLKFANL